MGWLCEVINNNRTAMEATSRSSRVQYYKPYFTDEEVQHLSEKQRGKLSQSQEDRARQQACAFIDSIGAKLGL
jgi:CTD kinase subunit beta